MVNIHESGQLCKRSRPVYRSSTHQQVARPIRDPAPAPRTVPRMVCLDFLPPTAYRPANPPPRAPKSPCEKSYLDIVPDALRLVAVVADIAVEDNVVVDMNHKDVNNDAQIDMLHHILHDCECNLHDLRE